MGKPPVLLALLGQDPVVPVTEAALALGFVPSLPRSGSCWEKKSNCPYSRKFLLEWPFLSSHLGASFLAPVRVGKGKRRVREGERCMQENIHSFIHSTNISLAQMPARPRARCCNSLMNLVQFLLSKSSQYVGRWLCQQTIQSGRR